MSLEVPNLLLNVNIGWENRFDCVLYAFYFNCGKSSRVTDPFSNVRQTVVLVHIVIHLLFLSSRQFDCSDQS